MYSYITATGNVILSIINMFKSSKTFFKYPTVCFWISHYSFLEFAWPAPSVGQQKARIAASSSKIIENPEITDFEVGKTTMPNCVPAPGNAFPERSGMFKKHFW